MGLLNVTSLSAAGKPVSGLKVICVGDSITAGYDVSISYPAHLANLLGSGYTVVNYGVSGTTLLKKGDFPYWSTKEYASSLRSSPDIVIIQLGTNDSKPENWQYKSNFVNDYKELINNYKNLPSHPAVYVALSPTVFGEGNWGITNQVVTNEVVPLTIQAATETGSTIIDNNSLTANIPQNFPDHVHPDNTGTAILANNVYAAITSAALAFKHRAGSSLQRKFEYRMARPNEREECIDLANYAFRLDFESLMPKVYGKNVDCPAMHMVAADEQGRLRAQVAILPESLSVCGHSLRIGYLGTVSVHPRARGEGHMKALMNMWLEELRKSYDMVVLYGQRQRYEYFGFTLGGVKYKYIVGDANVRHALKQVDEKGLIFRPLFEVEGSEAFAQRINAARPAYVHRDLQQLPHILTTLYQQALGVLDSERLIGYILTDQAGEEISEFALENTDDISRTIKAYMAHIGTERISIYAPEYEIALNAALGSFAEDFVIETSDMYHIFDFANVLRAYLTLKHKTIGLAAGEFSAIMDEQPVTARVDASGVTVERSAKPGAVVLSKEQAQTLMLTQHGRYMAVPVPAGWFPLPIYWYKVDKF
jgi:lysophospholipase L1-like esterase/predicted N-acetyltransferase YhbS